ncbi:MAG: hypothetical protein JO099_10420 [Acidobacteriia bacterium]|nr:hypothetical protein [Terriglobia bacterium]
MDDTLNTANRGAIVALAAWRGNQIHQLLNGGVGGRNGRQGEGCGSRIAVFLASGTVLRRNSKAEPCNRLFPDLVTRATVASAARPPNAWRQRRAASKPRRERMNSSDSPY